MRFYKSFHFIINLLKGIFKKLKIPNLKSTHQKPFSIYFQSAEASSYQI